jgi:hypothetical protein
LIPVAAWPSTDQCGVIRGRPALNQRVPDDIGPGKLDQVGAAVTVSEYPPIAPELVEPAEIAGGNPPPRLVLVAAACPPVGEMPQVLVQGAEHPGRHHRPVVGGPAPHDRGKPDNDSHRVRSAQRAHLDREPFPEPPDRLLARLDQQLAIRVTPQIESQEIEPLRRGPDVRLLLPTRRRPPRVLTRRLSCMDEVIGRRNVRSCCAVPKLCQQVKNGESLVETASSWNLDGLPLIGKRLMRRWSSSQCVEATDKESRIAIPRLRYLRGLAMMVNDDELSSAINALIMALRLQMQGLGRSALDIANLAFVEWLAIRITSPREMVIDSLSTAESWRGNPSL